MTDVLSGILDPPTSATPVEGPRAVATSATKAPGIDVLSDVLDESLSGQQFFGPREVSQDTAGAADISDVAAASLANEPKAQIRFYAEQMNIPEDRFGIVGGQIAYATEDGTLQAVDPGLLRGAAKAVGPAIPAVVGAVGSVLGAAATAPTGPGAIAGMAGGGVLGASAGQLAREGVAKAFIGDQEMSAARVAGEGAIDLAATVAGLGIGKGLTKAAASRAGKEFAKAMKGGAQSTADALAKTLKIVNKRYGTNIKLTPAELSNAAMLRTQQIALGNDPKVGQQLEDFAVARGRDSEKAMMQYLMELSPQADRDAAGEGFRDAAQKGLDAIKRDRVSKGSPIYQKAFKESDEAGGVDISPVLVEIDRKLAKYPPAKEILEDIHGSLMPNGQPVRNLEYIQDNVKEQLDDAIAAATRAGKGKLAGRLNSVRKVLLDTLDEQVPTFKEARALWGDLSAPITRAQGGALPSLAKKTQKDFEYLGARFFNSASPAEIARAKKNMLGSLQEGSARYREGLDAWNAALRGYLETTWEQAGRVYKSSIGRQDIGKAAQPASFWATLKGNPAQQSRLKAAMDPMQYRAFENLMDVFEATGRALNFNSTTAAQTLGNESIKAGGITQATTANVVDPIGIFRSMRGGVQNFFDGKNAQLLTDIITNADSVKVLLKVGARSTTRDRAALLVMKALNLARTQATSGPGAGDEFLPPAMEQTRDATSN